jgi:hypothetical protein
MNISNYLKDKSVIIVGPAPTVIDKCDYIESFDVVVRLNNSFNTKGLENDIGFRTDLLYLNTNNTKKLIVNKKYLDVLINFNIDYIITKVKTNLEKCIFLNTKKYESYSNIKCYDSSKSQFNLGILSILDLLTYDIKSLNVTGFTFYDKSFDFYRDEYRKDIKYGDFTWIEDGRKVERDKYRTSQIGHNQNIQKEFIKNLLNKDNRISFCKTTKKYLYS